MKAKDKKKTDQVNEPETAYSNKRITFFKSFEEENEDTRRYYASLTPEERLMQVNELVKRNFADELLAHPTLGNRIHFD